MNTKREIRNFGGVIESFKKATIYADEKPTGYEEKTEVSYYCYECFNRISLVPSETQQKVHSQEHWDGFRDVIIYPIHCSECGNLLSEEPLYCCEEHQLPFYADTTKALYIMMKQIIQDNTLCTYYVTMATYYSTFTNTQVDALLRAGKNNIKLFGATPAGMLLEAIRLELENEGE